ncbi:MAG: arginine--tRNA ligase [Lachnospiraceae bacterium]|nr:arginine--tRNA ligase [Lachnospiraceae bacterium]
MKKILDVLTNELESAFRAAGYDAKNAKASVSNRPDLCQYQCNGAMALAKEAHKAPIMIANEVAEKLAESEIIVDVNAVNPGFLNFNISPEFLEKYLNDMASDERFGVEKEGSAKKIVVDFGGPNVAKPLHVGHLRSAIIGESIKRICKYMGNEVIGDIHLGDWGLQMGLIITELKKRQPDLPYFDDSFEGEYPEEAPFTISELEEIYPTASAKSKEDEVYKKEALEATFKLQTGNKGYRAIWKHIMSVSVADLKKNYQNLNVSFDWWKGESDVQDDIAPMVDDLKSRGFAYESEGALVVDVALESDTKEVPPCMILKSDGAALYTTTDLATLLQRKSLFGPDQVIYVVDKRQDMHFVQVFRCAKKTGIVDEDVKLDFVGFGTMNGKDGKPFKTREGGVMRLEVLLNDINEEMYKKITGNHDIEEAEARAISKTVGLAAVKYGDLSNQATKDYVFDIDKFTSFEGNTGPYILYTIVRIKSILNKYVEAGNSIEGLKIGKAANASELGLSLELTKLSAMLENAYMELAPHKICAYIYDVANAFNSFYHENKILTEEDKEKQTGWIALLLLTKGVLEMCIDLLGFEAPEHM